jgi:ABC-type amino acid transport substrate-binding protein
MTGNGARGSTMTRMILGLLLWAATTRSALAVEVVKPLKAADYLVRNRYPFELLDEVLKRTTPGWGPYVERPFTAPISVARGHQEALKGELLNVLVSDVGHAILEEGMIPVPFPIDKGLLGYRVALIDKRNQRKIAAVNNAEQLRSLRIGQGSNWGDVRIYEHNRVPVETATTYESLFPMLLAGRFDLFPRGVTEVTLELAEYGPRFPDLAIDQHLLIRYPYAQCFYVSKSEPRLAARLEAGLKQMAKDGSFDALFDKYFARPLRDLRLDRRVIVDLDNPFLPAWVPLDRRELWFDVGTLR